LIFHKIDNKNRAFPGKPQRSAFPGLGVFRLFFPPRKIKEKTGVWGRFNEENKKERLF